MVSFKGNRAQVHALGPVSIGRKDNEMSERKPGGLTAKDPIKAQIDENLKRVYETALSEEVPDRFKQLLAQLKQKEQQT